MCWCAVKKLLTHFDTEKGQFWWGKGRLIVKYGDFLPRTVRTQLNRGFFDRVVWWLERRLACKNHVPLAPKVSFLEQMEEENRGRASNHSSPIKRPINMEEKISLVSKLIAFRALTLLVPCQEQHPAGKNRLIRCWHGYLSGARCRWFAYGPADATATRSSLASLKSRLVWPFWCRLTQVVLVKRPLDGCSFVWGWLVAERAP